jgi:hypothetical protein
VEPLDGNAIAGQLTEAFGRDMTMARGTCAHCGTEALIAELRVYTRAPGPVARCRHCGQVVFVVTEIRGVTRIDLGSFRLLEPPDSPS